MKRSSPEVIPPTPPVTPPTAPPATPPTEPTAPPIDPTAPPSAPPRLRPRAEVSPVKATPKRTTQQPNRTDLKWQFCNAFMAANSTGTKVSVK